MPLWSSGFHGIDYWISFTSLTSGTMPEATKASLVVLGLSVLANMDKACAFTF